MKAVTWQGKREVSVEDVPDPRVAAVTASSRELATITPYRDGPLLVRGPVRLQDMHGAEIEVGRETIALCRCGKSRSKPFCDATHKLSGFRARSEADARGG